MPEIFYLSLMELKGLTRCFGCGFGYLASPVLSIVDPSTNKGKARAKHLRDLLDSTRGRDFVHRFAVENALSHLERGKRITYASYRVACREAQYACDAMEREQMKRQRARRRDPLAADQVTTRQKRIEAIRDKSHTQDIQERLAVIRRLIDAAKVQRRVVSSIDLLSIAEYSKRDLYGAIALSILYGEALAVQKLSA